MDNPDFSSIISLITALSVATERLAEIVKGWCPTLAAPSAGTTPDPKDEAKRQAKIQLLAAGCGIFTAWMSWAPINSLGVFKTLLGESPGWWEGMAVIIPLGLLASGGSGAWNSVSTWLKDRADAPKETPKPLPQGVTGSLSMPP